MDVAKLSELFMEAAETERKLPAAIRRQKMSAWPDYGMASIWLQCF